MPPLDQNELEAFYTLMRLAPGKTQAQKLNYLQDWGFKPFAASQPKQFVEQTMPTYTNPMDVYASNEDIRSVFDLISNYGLDPISAVEKVGLPTTFNPQFGDTINYVDIANKFAQAEAENEAKRQNWQNEQAYQRAKFEADQASQTPPLTMKDVLGKSQYEVWSEAAGEPLTSDLLLKKYKEATARKATPMRGYDPKKAPAPMPTGEFKSFVSTGNKKLDDYLDQQTKNYLEMRLAEAKQKRVPSETGSSFLAALQAQRMMGE